LCVTCIVTPHNKVIHSFIIVEKTYATKQKTLKVPFLDLEKNVKNVKKRKSNDM